MQQANNTVLQKAYGYRWRICAFLFFATTVNYIDRSVLSFTMLDDVFRHQMLGIPEGQPLTAANLAEFKTMMGYLDAAFKAAYALGFLFIGYVIDRLGTRNGFSLAMGVWSIAAVLNGFVGGLKSMSLTRLLLGLGESGNFPSAAKTVAEWFPKKERSFAAGLFNAGANIGAILTALAVPWLTLRYGWRAAFVVTGLLGFIALLLWRLYYRKPDKHPALSPEELAHIQQDGKEEPGKSVSWKTLLRYRQTWAVAAGKFFADPIWYFYLGWLPDFFNSNEALSHKLDFKNIGLPFLVVYLVSDVGSIFFGWLSSRLIQKGWTVNKARKFTMLICALCVTPIILASVTANVFIAVALIALAAAAHQGWSANMYTLASDMFPRQWVGSVVAFGSMAGAISGIAFAASTGYIRANFGYIPLFVMAGGAYLTGLFILHRLAPDLKPIKPAD